MRAYKIVSSFTIGILLIIAGIVKVISYFTHWPDSFSYKLLVAIYIILIIMGVLFMLGGVSYGPFPRSIIIIMFLLVAGCFIIFGLFYYLEENKLLIIPDITGMHIDDAKSATIGKGLNIIVREEEFSNDKAKGIILKQLPAPGEKARPGKLILVTISRGAKKIVDKKVIVVPDITGMHLYDAYKIVKARELSLNQKEEVVSGEKGELIILKQSPAPGEKLGPGDTIYVTISKGAKP